jgi:hypothetical protein
MTAISTSDKRLDYVKASGTGKCRLCRAQGFVWVAHVYGLLVLRVRHATNVGGFLTDNQIQIGLSMQYPHLLWYGTRSGNQVSVK